MSALQYMKTGVLLATLGHVTGYTVSVKQGDNAVLSLPRIELCGQYTLLDPLLRPMIVVESGRVANSIGGPNANRVKIEPTSDGFRFTLRNVTSEDAGSYKLATSSLTTLECINQSYDISVSAVTGVSFTTWSSWSNCSVECSPKILRTRTRKCTVVGGCFDLGKTEETQSCAKGDNCGQWSAWGPWGECSAKCGKGFQIRKRACVSDNAALMKSSLCHGQSTHSQMCLIVCEVVGSWSTWSEWSACSTTCGSGTRSRSRDCSNKTTSPDVTLNCSRGNKTEKESCVSTCIANMDIKNLTNPTTSASPLGLTSEVMTTEQTNSSPVIEIVQNVTTTSPPDVTWRDDKLTVAMTAAGIACGVTVAAVVVVVCVLECCRKGEQRRPSLPTIRPANEATKRRQNTSKSKSPVTGDTIDGNVYSEFNSGWPSNEFDSTYALDDGEFDEEDADETRKPDNENIEDGDNLWNEENDIVDAKHAKALGTSNPAFPDKVADFDESEAIRSTKYNVELLGSFKSSAPAVCERKETTYTKSRVSFQKYSADSGFADKSGNNYFADVNLEIGGQASMPNLKETDDDEEVVENVFYEPPELWSVHDVNHADKMDSLRRESETMFREESKDPARSYKFSGSTGVYYEPPEEDQDTSANERVHDEAEEEHIYDDEESLYRNCETANAGGWLSFDNGSTLPWNGGQHISDQGNIDNKYERNAGDDKFNELGRKTNENAGESIVNVNSHLDPEEHVYENGRFIANALYESPKYNFGTNSSVNGRGPGVKNRIYDVPNFTN